MNKLPYHWEDYLLSLVLSGVDEEMAIKSTVHHYHKGEQMGRSGLSSDKFKSLSKVQSAWYGK